METDKECSSVKSKLMLKLRKPQSTGTADMAHNICKFKQKTLENLRTKSCQKLIKHSTGTFARLTELLLRKLRFLAMCFYLEISNLYR